MSYVKYLIIVLLLSSQPASTLAGGTTVKNGGDGVYLNGKLYLLDLAEANIAEAAHFKNYKAFHPNVINWFKTSSSSILQKIDTPSLLSKLTEIHGVNPRLSWMIRKSINSFKWRFVKIKKDIRDERRINNFKRTNLVQLAIREKKEITIDPYYWRLLDDRNKIALVFHEVIYSLIVPSNHRARVQDSSVARKFVASLFSRLTIHSFAHLPRRLPNFSQVIHGLNYEEKNGQFRESYFEVTLTGNRFNKRLQIESFKNLENNNFESLADFCNKIPSVGGNRLLSAKIDHIIISYDLGFELIGQSGKEQWFLKVSKKIEKRFLNSFLTSKYSTKKRCVGPIALTIDKWARLTNIK